MEETKDESKERGVSWKEIVGVIGTLLAAIAGYSFQGIRFFYYFTWFFAFLLTVYLEYYFSSKQLITVEKLLMLLAAVLLTYPLFDKFYLLAYNGDNLSLLRISLFLFWVSLASYLAFEFAYHIARKCSQNPEAVYFLVILFIGFLIWIIHTPTYLHSYQTDYTIKGDANCCTNLLQFPNDPNHVLIYGPQELILSFGDGNIQVVKPWQPVVVEKNKLCEANLAIMTSLGVTGCRKPSICQSLKKGDNEKPKDSNHK